MSPASDSAAYHRLGAFCVRTRRELASLVIEQAFQMGADNVRGLQLDEALFIRHLLDATVAPEGRLIIGPNSEVAGSEPQLQAEVAAWGFRIAGAIEVPHAHDYRVVRRTFWFELST